MARDAHEAHPGPKDETMTMMKDYATEDSRGGRSVYVGQKWGPACNYPEGSNTCLTITYKGNDIYFIQVGIDIYMSRQEAQGIIDAGSKIGAQLVSDDTDVDRVLCTVRTKYVRVGDDGLGAEFEIEIGSRLIDEDNGRDEVYASIWLADRLNQQNLRFTSGVIAADFATQP